MGSFRTSLQVELIDPLAHKGQGLWRLIQPLIFEDDAGTYWSVPADFETDFASVPRVPFVYAAVGNTAHAPSALHDWAIRSKVCPRPHADELFRQAMESIGMPRWRVGMMFRAVSAETRNLEQREEQKWL